MPHLLPAIFSHKATASRTEQLFSARRRYYKLPHSGVAVKRVKGRDQVKAVDIVAHLLSLVTENGVFLAGDGTFHQVRQKSVQHRAGMIGPGQATARKLAVFILK